MREAENHPRPQLVRAGWRDLCGEWQFSHDDDNRGLRERWQDREEGFKRRIQVPFPPESPASGIADPTAHPVVWYRRTFGIDPLHQGRWLLHFGAVDFRAQVWVNGSLVASHVGGHTPFSADVTGPARADGDNVLVVRAEDSTGDLAQVRGKQYWGTPPEEVWYQRTTGIWQPVWLEPVPTSHIAMLRWSPDLPNTRLGLEVGLNAAPAPGLRVRIVLRRANGSLVADDVCTLTGAILRRTVSVDIGAPSIARRRDLVWSPEYPNLLDAELTLLDGDTVVDRVSSYVGLRSVDVADGRVRLNGWPYYLRLVLAQGYWPETHLAAPDNASLRREVELVRELGFNGVRVHQKVEDPRFLYWCDRLGLLVWEEMPSHYVFTPLAVEALTREWLEVMRRDHSHPCIVAWVCFNESWGIDELAGDPRQRAYVEGIQRLTRAVDGSRPVIANDGWEYLGGEILGIHDYALDPQVMRERYGDEESVQRTLAAVQPNSHALDLSDRRARSRPAVVLSECGGVGSRPVDGKPWFGYGAVGAGDDLHDAYRELIGTVLASTALAGFCYTQLVDTEQEVNGLLDASRKPKVDPWRIRAANRRAAAAIPGELMLSHILHATDVSPNRPDGDKTG
ncbi:MAG: glycoside hydrolase family 2 protein [Candidatus Dormibacteria bacterium]